MTDGAQLVLASASPRRAALLADIGLAFRVVRPEIDERAAPGERPEAYVERLARSKAAAGRRLAPGAALPVLAADTAVVLAGSVLGKPGDAEAARAMLRALSGRTHEVLSAVAVHPVGAHPGSVQARVSRTRVTFRELRTEEIRRYWETGEPRDKAGGYGIQGIGGIFVDRLEGSYTNVVGLPVAETEALLRAAGVDTWSRRGVPPPAGAL